MKKYMKCLLSNSFFYDQILAFYYADVKDEFHRTFIQNVEEDMKSFIYDDFVDLDGFYEHATKNYINFVNNDYESNVHIGITHSQFTEQYPKYVYCIELFVYLHYQKVKLEKKQSTLTDAEEVALYNINNQYALLEDFLESNDTLIETWLVDLAANEATYYDDDLQDLSVRALELRLLRAISENKTNEALILLGSLGKNLDKNTLNYLRAIIYDKIDNYETCIHYAKRVSKEFNKYGDALKILLKAYANAGDFNGFTECMMSLEEIDLSTFRYLIMCLLLHLKEADLAKIDNFLIKVDDKINNNQTSEIYSRLCISLAARVFMEAFEILDEMRLLYHSNYTFTLPKKVHYRLDQLHGAIQVFNVEYKDYIDYDFVKDISDEDYDKYKKEIVDSIGTFLLYNNPNGNFDVIKDAFMLCYRLGQIDDFISLIDTHYDLLVGYADNRNEYSANELLQFAYIENELRGICNNKLKGRIEKEMKDDLIQDVQLNRIYQFLTPKGKTALESAEWNFSRSKQENYGGKDAGMIAFGYSRIFEVELRDKFVIPIMNSIGEDEVKKLFDNKLLEDTHLSYPIVYLQAHCNELDTCSNNIKNKWTKIIDEYKKYHNKNKDLQSFTLGELYVFFSYIGFQYNPNDPIATLIRQHFYDILTEDGITELESNEGFFAEISGENIRNTFRNPPAHTRYMSFDVAVECRNTFIEFMLKMIKLFK